ncbi:MAG: DUF4249 domain-containing protein [Bacteroidia bacterium]
MKNILIIVSVLFFGLTFTSCEEVLDIDVPDNTEKIVIEGQITTEIDSSFIRVTKSVGYFNNTNSTPLITDAVVDVNGIAFNHVGNGIYKASSGFVGTAGAIYNLKVTHQGVTYTSSSTIEPMFEVDTVVSYFKPESGFIEEGYAVAFFAIDNRPRTKYTYFRFGFRNQEDTKGKDSLFDVRVLFDNRNSVINEPYVFELPFLRLQPNDTAVLVFRSIDENVNRYYLALNNRDNSGGPFSTPPANLPTNIKGGALGLFAAYDVKRYQVPIKQ